jgi:hypothetical protein
VVKGKYINEEARKVYKKDEEKSNFPNVKVGLDEIKDDMLKMMDKIDALESAVRILAHRINRLDGMGK